MTKIAKVFLAIGISTIIIFALILGFTVCLFNGVFARTIGEDVKSTPALIVSMSKDFDNLKERTVFVLDLDQIGEANGFDLKDCEERRKGCEKSSVQFQSYGIRGSVVVDEQTCNVQIEASLCEETVTDEEKQLDGIEGEEVLLDGISAKISQKSAKKFHASLVLGDLFVVIELFFDNEGATITGENARFIAEAIVKTRTEVGTLLG